MGHYLVSVNVEWLPPISGCQEFVIENTAVLTYTKYGAAAGAKHLKLDTHITSQVQPTLKSQLVQGLRFEKTPVIQLL